MRSYTFSLFSVLLLFPVVVLAQQNKTVPVDNDFVQKQFGTTCSLMPGPQPQIADLDGDGIADIVIVAHCKNPMMDESEHGFRVIDPYNAFFGYGSPQVTSQFASEDPQMRGLVLLVIHGTGPEAWRSATPKMKFVIINLPFKSIVVKKLALRKKMVMAIFAEETGADNMTSTIFWDGRKYRYQPLGSGLE